MQVCKWCSLFGGNQMYPHTPNTHSDTLNHSAASKLSMDLSQSTSNIHLQLFVVFLLLALSLLSCCIISAHHLECVVLLKKFWPFFFSYSLRHSQANIRVPFKEITAQMQCYFRGMGARGLQQSIWQVMQELPGEITIKKQGFCFLNQCL